jgi:DNA-binding response OmpR family regulator
MGASILWVEGRRAESPSFIPGLRKKGYKVEIVSSGNQALSRLGEFDPDLLILNTASFRTSGKRLCRALRERAGSIPLLVITDQNHAAIHPLEANAVIQLPFTTRKLLNRITHLLPGDGKNLLHIGPIRLDLERKVVRCQGHESTLTPRLALLLRLFMEHPGEALERVWLFREVWETEYTADTRTLDVHISWLRRAIEQNPRKPRYLITIRGLGYRLDV